MVRRSTTEAPRRAVPPGRRELRAEGEKLLWQMFGREPAGEGAGTVRNAVVEAMRRRGQAAQEGAARKTR